MQNTEALGMDLQFCPSCFFRSLSFTGEPSLMMRSSHITMTLKRKPLIFFGFSAKLRIELELRHGRRRRPCEVYRPAARLCEL